ncbi:MAG TPA: FxLYD domain-containing protein [Pyrinomonadaceae bacterium]|nr:FxLYD domain-containing protein [Pyrinomonadaceae bacterium]
MRSARGRLLVCTLLLIGAACSPSPPSPPKVVQYNLQTTCSGGGGRHTCVSKNPTDDKLGPFDLEVEFLDDRGISIGKTLMRNDQGIDSKGEWNFDVTGPVRTRSLRFGRVIPRG